MKKGSRTKSLSVPMPVPRQTRQEQQWQAEEDARTIANAEAIKADLKRFRLASGAAKRLASEQLTKAKAMLRVASSRMPARAKLSGPAYVSKKKRS